MTPPKTGWIAQKWGSCPPLNLQTPLPRPVHRLRMPSPGAFGDGIVLGDVAIHAFPYSFFSHPNLTWTDGDSSGCGPGLLGSLPGKCFTPGQESLPEPRRGTGCWQGCQQAACGELVWGGSCSSKEQFSPWFRQLWCATEQAFVHLNFPLSHFFSTRKCQTCTETYLQKANLFSCVIHPSLSV